MNARFWGDYSHILIGGLGQYCDRQDGRIVLHRTGPFVPPITVPGDGIVVTDGFRGVLEVEFPGLKFQPVVKKRIVSLRWETWDRTAPGPKHLPIGGEPENYILRRRHSDDVSQRIGPLWELVIEKCIEFRAVWNRENTNCVFHVLKRSWNGEPFASLNHSLFRIPVVTEKAKAFLESHANEWLQFEDVKVVEELPARLPDGAGS